MNLIDTHTHLNDFEAYPDYDEVIRALPGNNIAGIIVIGADRKSSEDAVRLAETYDDVYAALGTHPSDADNFTDEDAAYYADTAARQSKVVAIGEAGLDYHYAGYDRKRQAEVFVRHLEIAFAAKLPVVIHLRDAFADTVNLLKAHKHLLLYGGLLHCYSGSAEFLHEVFALNLDIALGGTVTFKNAHKPTEVARAVPLDRLHLETDCPYLAPTPYRGQRNEPKYVNLVAEKIAELRGITLEELAEQTNKNARRLFARMGELKRES